jgi:hypothetical protein
MTASYVHFYFPSNPAAVAALFAPDLEPSQAWLSDNASPRRARRGLPRHRRTPRHAPLQRWQVAPELLRRLLEAAHQAPSVG